MIWWNRWVQLLDHREAPTVLALLRIGLPLVLLCDFFMIAHLDLVESLWADDQFGGLSDVDGNKVTAPIHRLLPPDGATARLLFGLLCASAFTTMVGLFSRTSTLVLLLASTQSALIAPDADRAIDTLVRNLLFLLVFSGAGRCWSVDAWWKGNLHGRGVEVAAWPRYLAVLQLIVMYFTAGVQKVGLPWTPFGGFSALYIILQDWAIANRDYSWLAGQPWYFFTQFSTFITVVWQASMPIVLLFYWYEATPDRPGRFRALTNRYHLHLPWLAIGAFFHLGIALTMQLGIFPWAMLAAYAAFLRPKDLDRFYESVQRFMNRGGKGSDPGSKPGTEPATSPG